MITIPVLLLSFLTALSCKIKKVKAPYIRLIVWNLHFILLFFSLLSLLLLLNGYGFKGIQTERVFLTLYAGTGMVLYGLTPPEISARYLYLQCLYGFPFVLILGLLLPFLRIFTVMIAVALLHDGNFIRYPIDHDFSLQTKTTGILSPLPAYSLVEDKYWFFEKVTDDVVTPVSEVQKVMVKKMGDDSVRIMLPAFPRRGMVMDTVIGLQR